MISSFKKINRSKFDFNTSFLLKITNEHIKLV